MNYLTDSFCEQGYKTENTVVSTEERQILNELEADIEEDLEREIIDSLCRLARHLQRLYQHKDTRKLTGSATDYQFALSYTHSMFLSELNIRITLDGQCGIDITKVEQDAAAIQPKSNEPNKRQGSMKTRQDDTVYCRKQRNHPVAPWR
jgi:hypothetical protein